MYYIYNSVSLMLVATCSTLEIAKKFVKDFKRIDKILYNKPCKYKIIKKEV